MMNIFEKVLDTKAFESPVRLHELLRKTSTDLHSTNSKAAKIHLKLQLNEIK